MSSDPLPIFWGMLFVLLLVFLNGFFVAAEFAMVKVRGSRLDTLVQEGNAKAKLTRHVTEHLDAYLSACQLGITLASLGLGWIGEKTVAQLLYKPLTALGAGTAVITSISTAIAFIFITVLHIVLGELAPKTLAIRKSERVALWTAGPLSLFYKVMYPFIWLLNGTANLVLKLFGIEPASEHESAHTEEEIRILVKESHKSGYIDNTELALVDNIFDFTETHAREIMIPRTDMICLYVQDSFEVNKTKVLTEMHTRYPVCDNDKDNIIGFIHIRDIVKAPENLDSIRSIVRPMLSVPESMSISALLKLMQKNKVQIALLIDEFGGTAGLVTLEDIMEEIVGEIQDEFDEERPQIEKKNETNFSIDGRLLIEEVNAYFGTEISSEDYDTIGGWMYAMVEVPPRVGQRTRVEGAFEYEFIVEETDHFRIARLHVKKLGAASNHDSMMNTASSI
ncbi:hemolysin family protein [Paenibacillus alvei]|uniref:Hemolysin family protein n=3 Tax=Paenibacillus TaxID=44249 RepID=A0ABT4H448_PAEAL|nr:MULTISPECIES: hemolysin family protein [Paenibacillus]MCY7483922.1 hemolysin family protein [Paenibacillus alvei]MCY9541538.1 hemolysin family protein [Paenibacillus alvei]MCY9734972.1 hemolysin family protein [Paenibacillus alvei]MCY9754285.1 hemolysin family protein [Paenibacillus alvei]MCY9763416.1 hemolysin family protein [Paenibacillus alvei]